MRVLAGGRIVVDDDDDDGALAAGDVVGDDAPIAATVGDDAAVDAAACDDAAADVPMNAEAAPVDEAELRNSRSGRSAPAVRLCVFSHAARVTRLTAAWEFVNMPVTEPASAPAGQSVRCLRIVRVNVRVTQCGYGVLAADDAVQRAADALGCLVSRQQLTAALVHPPAAGVNHDALRKELCKRLQQGKLVLPCMERVRYKGIGRKLMVAPRPLAGADQQTTNGINPGRLSLQREREERKVTAVEDGEDP